jgi:hypothetical protein
MARRGVGVRVDQWAKRNPTVVVLSLAAVLVAAVITLVGAGGSIIDWYERTFRWRQAEYARLEGLRAGFTLAQFERTLGNPLFARPTPKGGLVESTFRGRDYWAQAVSNRQGTVLLYAVTSCSADFTPRFALPVYGRNVSVTLNRSTFAAVLPHDELSRERADYFASGASGDTYYYDEWYGANPGFYKEFAWGVNDACPDWFPEQKALERKGLLPDYPLRQWNGYVAEGGPSVARFRANVAVNTYAETAPLVDFPKLGGGLHIGADRILIRTVTGVN